MTIHRLLSVSSVRLFANVTKPTLFSRINAPGPNSGRRCISTKLDNAANTVIQNQSSSSSFVKNRVDNIITSPEDKRLYRGLELNNDLKVLLISDPMTDKSAASLDVNVGHLHDPKQLPGLAHFCEHMLFLGTDKYPVENDYQKYLTLHSGCSNAYTSTDHTNYHFDVAPEHLEGALDRFAQFFVSPLFTESCTEREVMAVDSEHNNNVQNDSWRFQQLERTLSNPNHAYSKFGTGNRITLLEDAKLKGMEPRAELLKFHQNHYSSNLMTISVLGKESLDELQNIIAPLFSQIPNKSLPVPQWIDHPYGKEQIGYHINVVPVKDIRSMNVSFPIPDYQPYYRSNPGHYMAHLLGHEGKGSLLSELKRRGWVNSLAAGPLTSARGFGFFSIDVELTPEGLERTDEILTLIFQYINMLKAQGPQEWIHREVASISEMNFRFKDKVKPQFYVVGVAASMHVFPLSEVLYGSYMMPDYNPKLINDLLDRLNVHNFNYYVIGQRFKDRVDNKEKWYGTEYCRQPINESLLSQCQSISGSSSDCPFMLPEPNSFIPTNFDLFQRDSPNEKESKFPQLLHDDSQFRLWYKQDDEYLLPKCCVFMHCQNPIVYQSPLNAVKASIFAELLNDSLTEYSYDAQLAGLVYNLSSGNYGFWLNVSGYNEKQKILLEKLITKLVTFKPDRARFDVLKERYVRNLRNFAMEQPYKQAVYYSNLILTERIWSVGECLKEAEGLTIEQIESFIPQFFDALHIEAFVHGNTDRYTAENLVSTVQENLKAHVKPRSLYSSQLAKIRSVCLPEGSFYRFKAENSTHPNSSLQVLLQTGVEDTKLNMLNELLSQIMSEPCFDQLRTKEQLGYIVFAGLNRANGSQCLRFIVQGGKTPEFMECRLEAFLVQMLQCIEKMSDEEFEKHKSSLASCRLEKPKKLSSLAQKYWAEISSEQYHFDRDNVEVKMLDSISKQDIIDFYTDFVSLNAPKRKKLSVYISSTATLNGQTNNNTATIDEASQSDCNTCVSKVEIPESEINKAEIIENIVEFKSQMPLYQLPKPQMEVPSAGLSDFAPRHSTNQ